MLWELYATCYKNDSSSLQGLIHKDTWWRAAQLAVPEASHLHMPFDWPRNLASSLIFTGSISRFRTLRERQCWVLNLEPLAPGLCSWLWENHTAASEEPVATITLASAALILGSHCPFSAAVNEASWLVKTEDHGQSCTAVWGEQAQAHLNGAPLVWIKAAPAGRGLNIIAIVETDRCFWVQPDRKSPGAGVQKAPPPALFQFPSHSASHHPTRCATFSSMTPCLSLSHKMALPRGMWFCWFGSLSSPSTEASAWHLPVTQSVSAERISLGRVPIQASLIQLQPTLPFSAGAQGGFSLTDLNPRLQALGCQGQEHALSMRAAAWGLTETQPPPPRKSATPEAAEARAWTCPVVPGLDSGRLR